MKLQRHLKVVSYLVMSAIATVSPMHVFAEVPDVQVERLETELTPIGAERAGSGNEIPAWNGGLTSVPTGVDYDEGKSLPNPFAADKPTLVIDAASAESHADRLTGTSRAILKHHPDYQMYVYPSRRSCGYPSHVYEATRSNARVGRLTDDGNGVAEAIMGFPFPIPNNAMEIVWNHSLRYRSFKVKRGFSVAPVGATGEYTLQSVEDNIIFAWSDPAKKRAEDLDNTSIYYIARTTAPARAAGNVILVYEAINANRQPRQAWQYSPGTRRVRRAPSIAYDNPGTNSDGLSTSDAFDGFNGAPDRYDWTLVGKSEKYIPYNSYDSERASVSEFLRPGHVNDALVRYEPHRVWTIEAKLKEGTRHVYSRRVMHIDEDSWQIAQTELYDGRGELWRAQELMSISRYNVPLCWSGAEIVYDFYSGRYLAVALQNELAPYDYFADELSRDNYTPNYIRQLGVR